MEERRSDFQSAEDGISAAPVKYCVKSGYVLREMEGEYLAIPVSLQDETESRIAVLSPVAKFLWEQLQQEKTIAELVEAVTDTYEVSEEEAEKDIQEFIERLQENKLISE